MIYLNVKSSSGKNDEYNKNYKREMNKIERKYIFLKDVFCGILTLNSKYKNNRKEKNTNTECNKKSPNEGIKKEMAK